MSTGIKEAENLACQYNFLSVSVRKTNMPVIQLTEETFSIGVTKVEGKIYIQNVNVS